MFLTYRGCGAVPVLLAGFSDFTDNTALLSVLRENKEQTHEEDVGGGSVAAAGRGIRVVSGQ
jgi:hypothetical protein